MKKTINLVILLTLSLAIHANDKQSSKEIKMLAQGSFDVTLAPQTDAINPTGRLLINKKYIGNIIGEGKGQMISKRTSNGIAVYYAIEEFEGSIDGKQGNFTLIHSGYMSAEEQTLAINILAGSGQGELENISGELSITQENNIHNYTLTYQLP